jgi:hypothetical protein
MPADFDRAVAFVCERGDELDRVRLNLILADGEREDDIPYHEVKRSVFQGQRPDGGWAPFWAPEYSSLDATCYRLAQGELTDLGLYHPECERALDFLAARQRPDGSWEEDESVRELAPPWAKPGELAARLYLTANCGWWLMNASPSTDPAYKDEAARAGAYLERYLAPDGSLPSFLQTYWLAAALWIRLYWRQPDPPDLAPRTLDHLATLLGDSVPAGALGWMLTTLAPLGVAPDHPALVKALALLAEQQRPDGGWTSEDGPDRDAYVTVQALLALVQGAAM